MQKNHPKSSALRQTKICMAVAAVVTAAALPGYAVANAGQAAAPQWEQTRDARVNALGADRGPIKTATETNYRATRELADKQELATLASTLTTAAATGDDEGEKFASFKAAISEIDKSLAALEGRRAPDGRFHGLDESHNTALTALKAAAVAISDQGKFDAGTERNTLNGLILTGTHTTAVTDAQRAATTAAQNLALLERKLAAWNAIGNEADSQRLGASYLLDVNAANADRNNNVLTWNDVNLKTHADESPAGSTGHTLLIADKTIEIGSFSGDASNAVHGAAGSARDIGTISALKDAAHDVRVASGTLNIHRGIDGEGALTVTAGEGGTVNFVAQPTGNGGITGENVTLVAGSAVGGGSGADDKGQINFENGMSAGTAKISLHSGGKLAFNGGANAGESEIAVDGAVTLDMVQARADDNVQRGVDREALLPVLTQGTGATLVFDESSVGKAKIANRGTLTITASDLSASTLTNEATGTVEIAGKMVGVFDENGDPVMVAGEAQREMKHSLGGTANVVNRGTLSATNLKFANMTLQNVTGRTTISNSEGGNAVVSNAQGATLAFSDTQLQQMRLTSSGNVNMAGATTANQSAIEMTGGVLDISGVSIDAAGTPEKTLTIGSLNGTGEIRTGSTTLVLGELNGDDSFAGTIANSAPIPKVDEQDASGTGENDSAPITMRMASVAVEAQPSREANVVKIGTGNLTLTGDQSGVTSLNVQGGTLTADHANALGSGTVSVARAGTVALSKNVSGVTSLQNEGTVDLGMNKLEVGTYASEPGAKIKSRIEKVDGEIAGGKIHVTQKGDFTNTVLDIAAADDIEIQDIVGKFDVVSADDQVEVTGGKVTVGSITGGKQPDPVIEGPNDPAIGPNVGTKITERNIVKFLAADGGYSANEQAVLASV
ncbi:hypothetical protein, partial [Pandoraea horticolens]|uniref:hypothetical protein n=1 Tax=Pandoraea horticolens TaxID=2508298 RepID=UPI00123F818A